MLSSPGCWAAYGALLEREYSDPELFAASHRLTVDAYAVQHPGLATDRRAVQSVTIHFASLHAILELGWSHADARAHLQRLAGRDYASLPAALRFDLTLADLDGLPVGQHRERVEQWAISAYRAWRPLLLSVVEPLFA
ncbi:MAG: hypothetical protein J0I47_04675 [Sphingomonas sp.]|nr:hypothetical protein [Sphingomonas sp.]